MAQLTRPQAGGGADTLLYLTTDHLGTPIQATDSAGAIVWEGGLDPFGTPFVFPQGEVPPEGGDRDTVVTGLSAGASATLETTGIFLRFPGQWDDPSFRSHGLREGLYYNVHRYYQSETGRYTRPDPLSAAMSDQSLVRASWLDIERFSSFAYVQGNPLSFIDPLGLLKLKGCTQDQQSRISTAFKEYCAETSTPEFKNCMCKNPGIPGGLRRLCGDPNLVVRCETREEGNCKANCAWSIPFGRTIRLCPGASEPVCGPLGCTLLHELTHILGHGGEKWPDEVERCLGCT